MISFSTQVFIRKLCLTVLLGAPAAAFAYELENQSLAQTVGATDYYQISCPANTDHLNFAVKDLSPSLQPAGQLINVRVSKDTLFQQGAGIKPTENSELITQGGAGTYAVSVDTSGTNTAITRPQRYKYQYQCLYADNSKTPLKSGPTRTIKNDATANFSISCADKKATRTRPAVLVSQLRLIVTNTTVPAKNTVVTPLLTAQLTRRAYDPNQTKIYTATVTDVNGDNNFGGAAMVQGGAGDYFLTAHTTGTAATADNARLYNLQLDCVNTANAETGTPAVTTLQDQ